MSPYLMGFCAENDVGVSFLTEYGRFLASVRGKVSGNILLRREQYRKADDLEFCREIAKVMIKGKLSNCRTVLQRAPDHNNKINSQKVGAASQKMLFSLLNLTALTLDEVRETEGNSALFILTF